jgi:hypothetical protein
MVNSRASLERLKKTSADELQQLEASLRTAEARLGAFRDSLTALGSSAHDAATTALIRRLQEKIKKEESEILNLQVGVTRARARSDGFDEVLRLLPRDGEDELRAGSTMYEVREVLRAAGHPMHLDPILKALNFEGREDKRNSLRGSLATYANKGRVFTKEEAQETFGLIEFHSNTANESK